MSESGTPPGSKKPKLEITSENISLPTVNWFSNVTSDRRVEHVQSVSQRDVAELVFEHTIHDLSLLPQKNGEAYFTQVFHAKSNPSIQWKLEIFPKGSINPDGKDHLSLFLHRVVVKSKDPPVVGVYKIILQQRDGKTICSKSCQQPLQFTDTAYSYGFSKFIKLDQLLGSNGLKIICQVVCEVKRKERLCVK